MFRFLSPSLQKLSHLSSSSSSSFLSTITKASTLKMEASEDRRKIFVAGATGDTGKRIVEQLLAKGFEVKAGVRDMEKAKKGFSENPSLEFVRADVTEGSLKLIEAIGEDTKAVICTTGFASLWHPFETWKVEKGGTVNLVDACKKTGVNRFVLVSSILVNGAAMGQYLNPAYLSGLSVGFLLVAKLQAEKYLRGSSLNYTIIRPAWLTNDPPTGNIYMEKEDTIYQKHTISREQVAEVVVEALGCEESSCKVVEIATLPDAPQRSIKDLYASIKRKQDSSFFSTITKASTAKMEGSGDKRKIFVAGATGETGKRIVKQLLAKGFEVKAGARDIERAKKTFAENPSLELVRADVTEGSLKLAKAIGEDTKAVICATRSSMNWWQPLEPWKVGKVGTVNLVDACKKTGVNRFVLVSSILVNGSAMGQSLNPAYIMGLVIGLVLIAKLQAEKYLRGSGINYTIIRPAWLTNDPPTGNIYMEKEDTIFQEHTISRDQVAEVIVEALVCEESSCKVVEIATLPDAPQRSIKDLYSSIKQQ